ncbi:hypothetical protein CL629_02050 [bacterium]|nr:hypothetical protein [bacterium]|tara:strand:+ start:3351 stop:3578 length:228 start_codon:yes stop_codon:yes gene_type:complete
MDEEADDDHFPDAKLYTRSLCMTCKGKNYSCYYCNGDGKNYIEASDKTIARWIVGVGEERRSDIMRCIKELDNEK